MTVRDQIIATDRFRRALIALQTAGWADPKDRVRADILVAAAEVVEAHQAFSATGLDASANDYRLVSQARQYLVESKA